MSDLYGQLLSRICHGNPSFLKPIGCCLSIAHSPRFLNCHPLIYTNLSVHCSFPFPIYCICFLLLLGQGTIKWVEESNTYFIPYNPRNQKSKVGFVELTSRYLWGCIPSITSGGEPVGLCLPASRDCLQCSLVFNVYHSHLCFSLHVTFSLTLTTTMGSTI